MKGYKTFLFALAVFALGVLQSTEFQQFLTQIHMNGNGLVTMGISAGIALLRMVTTTPPASK